MRIQSLDLARGFTVLFIPAIHTMMIYGETETYTSLLGWVFRFIAEGPGAQLLMFIMGWGIALSSPKNVKQIGKRALTLGALAMALNLAKFLVPKLWGGLPSDLLAELRREGLSGTPASLFSIGDILHFAALAYPLTAGIHKFRFGPFLALYLLLLILILSPQVWDRYSDHVIIHALLQLAGGHPPQVFFPLFPWLIYPLAGLVMGHLYGQRAMEKQLELSAMTQVFFRKTAAVGIILLLAGLFFYKVPSPQAWPEFYRTEAPGSLFHLGIVLIWTGFWEEIAPYLRASWIAKGLVFCSRHITTIYLIQWPLVLWGCGIIGYQTLGFPELLNAILIISFLSFTLTYLIHVKRSL